MGMSESSRRKRSSPKAANSKRSDQRSDPKKLRYKISRKIPDPSLRRPESKDELNDQQISIPFVPARGVSREAQPFLKWVGGKAQLLRQFDEFFPKTVTRYFEPFVGGGAVFFHLRHRFPRMKATLCDINPELINTYRAVQKHPRELMQFLDEHLKGFRADRVNYFKFVREQHDLPEGEVVERAARMIFLNKTCFNGLWRVNASGKFNVPIGSQIKPTLYDEENMLAASFALKDVDLKVLHFRDTFSRAEPGDFVYIDPPYIPISETSNFTSYTKEEFGPKEQHELARLFADAAHRGVRLMLSNSDSPLVDKLYEGFGIYKVRARRAINSDGAKRGEVNEVVVTNLKKGAGS